MPAFNPIAPLESAVGDAILELLKMVAQDHRGFRQLFRDTLAGQLKKSGKKNARIVERAADSLLSDPEIQRWLEGEQLPGNLSLVEALAGKLRLDAGFLREFFLAFEIAIAKNPTLNQILQNRRDASRNQSLEKLANREQEEIAIAQNREQQALSNYRAKLRQRFSTINLFGEQRERPGSEAASLERMADMARGFVPLHLTRWQDDGEDPAAEPLEIERLFFNQQERRFLLRGLPGSGKTTLLRYLAYCFAGKGPGGEDGDLPVYLRLKRLNLEKTTLEEFVSEQVNEDCDSAGDHDILCHKNRFLDRGMVLLFDGLDEIEHPQTAEGIAEALQELAGKHPRCKIIIASRPIGLQKQDYPKYLPFDLLPLSPPLVEAYLDRWFAGQTEKIKALRQTLENKPRIRELAENPFLLSMICYTFQQGDQKQGGATALIERRSDLYENCTRYLLQRLYDPENTPAPKVGRESALKILKDLSLRFFLWQESDFPADHVNVMGRRILSAELLGKTETFLDQVQRQTGMIQRASEGFTFVHRSLWEYFTALALLDKNPEFVIRQAANPDWEEVVRLYAGLLASPEAVKSLVNGLWNTNRPLTLRVTTEVSAPARELLQPLIEREEGNRSKLLLIDSLAQSLPLIAEHQRAKLVQETLGILLIDCEERDCEVIYYAQELLEKSGLQPLQPGGLIYKLLDLQHAAQRQEQLLADPANHFQWIEVEGGIFWMGDDEHDEDEKPARRVRLEGFRMAKHPVTNRLLSGFPFGAKFAGYGGESHPAIGNTWWEAYYFALWVDARLPSEAEWEYAARGGKKARRSRYYFGDDEQELPNHAWFGESGRPHAHAVDEANPRSGKENLNPLGLANMLGNVWEWCQDWYGRYPAPQKENEIIENPVGPKTGQSKVLRGGSFANPAELLRCARRNLLLPAYRYYDYAFRLVCGASH